MYNFLSIPEYMKKYVDKTIDLVNNSKICCPFHKEDTPSFSYNHNRGVWRCFGACHVGGADVISLHQLNFKLKTREEALESLRCLEGLEKLDNLNIHQTETLLDKEAIEINSLYQKCLIHASTVERYIQLDEVMSFNPLDATRLKVLLEEWVIDNEL